MDVIKINGEKEPFSALKIERTCLRAGASPQHAKTIALEVKKQIYPGISTKEIYKLTLRLLRKHPGLEQRYSLKQAIMRLGPHGFAFEYFVAALLKEHGFKTQVDVSVHGKCVPQEIDIVAEKERKYMIECKYHNQLGSYTDLKAMMYTYARFLDVKNKFDEGWLFCNTNCSSHALEYAKCVKLKVTSWQYPEKESLASLIHTKNLFPITILKSVDFAVKERFFQENILFVKNIVSMDVKLLRKKTGFSENALNKILKEAQTILF